jgi:hypothetical protein
MWEPSGSTSTDYSNEGNDGAYTGVTLGQVGIGDGHTCPLFDGANDFNNIYSAALNTDFDEKEGTLALWLKVSGVGVWTDGTFDAGMILTADGSNFLQIRKSSPDGRIDFMYTAGGTAKEVAKTGLTTTDWFHAAITWSVSGDKIIAYYDGAQEGVPVTGLGTWSGALFLTGTVIGASNTVPAQQWSGTLAHAALWKTPLTAPQVASLAVV